MSEKGKCHAPHGVCGLKILWQLFYEFFKIGLFTFGGGYAMLAVIEGTCVEKKEWITHDDMMNVTVIAESTPGPVAINCATFVGYQQAKLLGAVCATLGVVLPSFIIIYVISMFLDNFLEITLIANAFKGIKLAVGMLIANAGIKLIKGDKRKTPLTWVILTVSTVLAVALTLLGKSVSSVLFMLTAAVLGLAVYGVKRLSGKEGEGKK